MDREFKQKKMNNKGYTLVELLVVIAILGIMAGGISFGVNLAFSKDAERCATRINDEIYEARMAALSKPGIITVTISNDGKSNYSEINSSSMGSISKINLDGDESPAKTNISAVLTQVDGTVNELSLPLTIEFDKSKGCVNVGEGSITQNGIITITAVGGGKTANVNIVTATGKHKIGDLN